MLALSTEIRERPPRQCGSYPGMIDVMAKISVSLPDNLVVELQAVAHGNVSAFVAAAVRNELDRRRLHTLVQELEAELGPADEAEVAKFRALFAKIDAENARIAEGREAREGDA